MSLVQPTKISFQWILDGVSTTLLCFGTLVLLHKTLSNLRTKTKRVKLTPKKYSAVANMLTEMTVVCPIESKKSFVMLLDIPALFWRILTLKTEYMHWQNFAQSIGTS